MSNDKYEEDAGDFVLCENFHRNNREFKKNIFPQTYIEARKKNKMCSWGQNNNILFLIMKIEANWLQIYSKSCVNRTNFYFIYLSCEHWKLCQSVFKIYYSNKKVSELRLIYYNNNNKINYMKTYTQRRRSYSLTVWFLEEEWLSQP